MELGDFRIGESFWTYTGDEWRCTDIGTRVVVAIKLGPHEVVTTAANGQTSTRLDDDPSWFNGPPYAVEESVWDEDSIEVCFPSKEAMIADRED